MEYKLLRKSGALHEGAKPETVALRDQAALSSIPDIPHSVTQMLTESLARQHVLIPIACEGERLIVAAADASDIALADKLSFITAKNVQLVAAPRREIERAIERHYGRTETETVDSLISEFTDTQIDFADFDEDEYAATVGRHKLKDTLKQGESLGDLMQYAGRSARSRRDGLEAGGRPIDGDDERTPGFDSTPDVGGNGMWYEIIEEGKRVLARHKDGTIEIIEGPRRVWRGRTKFRDMQHYVAHPGEFLIARFRDGRQQHYPGPADIWFDPRVHKKITREDALQISAREAVVVYSKPEGDDAIARRIVYGPALFVPQPGEWLHTFSWHGSKGGSQGVEKIANSLVFQKLWLMPDQMYYDVREVRTANDAVLTVKLMIFFELLDIEKMLDTTHDPIGDLINAAASDVIEFTGKHDFESFKQHTDQLNELAAYKQLTSRAEHCGYRINKVVYRGYGAPDSLQQMHNQAIEARTRLQLERANEEQAQDLENYKLDCQLERADKRRTEQTVEVQHESELTDKKHAAETERRAVRHAQLLEQRRRERELALELRKNTDAQQVSHLDALRNLGVDMTAYLTQSRADRVIELRGESQGAHLHLDESETNGQHPNHGQAVGGSPSSD